MKSPNRFRKKTKTIDLVVIVNISVKFDIFGQYLQIYMADRIMQFINYDDKYHLALRETSS